MEYLPEGFKMRRLRAEYKTAAHLGNRMLPLVSRSEHCVTVVLADEEKSPYAVLEFCD
jgi:hypothetical protein